MKQTEDIYIVVSSPLVPRVPNDMLYRESKFLLYAEMYYMYIYIIHIVYIILYEGFTTFPTPEATSELQTPEG